MKISLCTTSMNRLYHVKETIPKNTQDNQDFSDLEFVLLNYNSSDEIDDWVRDTQMHLIEKGRLVYVKELDAKFFRPAHSRNVCALAASGDIICNVDADNFTGRGFASFIHDEFQGSLPAFAETYDRGVGNHLSSHGRIAIRKSDFLQLGGYDEQLVAWGGEDYDLAVRCRRLGFRRIVIGREFLHSIEHNWQERIGRINFSELGDEETSDLLENQELSNSKNRAYTHEKLMTRLFSANAGNSWGVASVQINFRETRRVGMRCPKCL